MGERTIAALRLAGEGDLPGIARPMVAAGAIRLGLDEESAAHLADATALVVDSVASHAFDDPTEVEVFVDLVLRDDAVVARVEDEGLPFAFRDEEDAVQQAMSSALVDEVHHGARDGGGNRTELVRHVESPHHDLRTTADLADHHEAHAAAPADAEVELTVRAMEPGDAERVARLTWRTYGYTYQHQEFYRPDMLGQIIEAGGMRSWIAIAPDGEVVGHTALVLEQPEALVAEGGRAMVDPRYRGHHVMKHLTSFRRDLVGDLGLFGVYADSVTEHTRSQALYGGAEQPVTGLLLGYLPPTVSFRRIEIDGVPRRQAVVMSYHPQRDHHEMTVHPPVVALDVLRRIYDSHELPRHFGEGAAPAAGTTSRIESRVWKDIGAALLVIEEPGADLRDAVRARLRSLRGAGIDVVYADVPLSHPGTPAAGEVLNGLGFVFGGVIPLLRDGGDVLRMQHLGDLDVDPDEIHLLSTMAQDILEYVLERREAVS